MKEKLRNQFLVLCLLFLSESNFFYGLSISVLVGLPEANFLICCGKAAKILISL